MFGLYFWKRAKGFCVSPSLLYIVLQSSFLTLNVIRKIKSFQIRVKIVSIAQTCDPWAAVSQNCFVRCQNQAICSEGLQLAYYNLSCCYYYFNFHGNIPLIALLHILFSAHENSKNSRLHFWQELIHRQRRSLDTEVTIQLLVVVDRDMINYHGNQSVEEYVLTVMNMVRKWAGKQPDLEQPAARLKLM